jgi:hypothetical protein
MKRTIETMGVVVVVDELQTLALTELRCNVVVRTVTNRL